MKAILCPSIFAVLIMGLAMVLSARAAEVKLTAGSDGANYDNFGWSVSISGDYVIVGAYTDDDPGPPLLTDAGSAYIYHRSGGTWTKQAKLTASDAEWFDWFGSSVSISADYAIVGAEKDNPDGAESGSAYVFQRSGTTWSQQDLLTAGSDGADFDHLGVSVSISGDYAIVGADDDDDPVAGLNSGSAYVFYRSGTTWSKQAKLTASDAAANDHFGCSVAISGEYAIVGAYGDDDPSGSGAAYVFHRSGTTWTQQAKLKSSDADPQGDKFGWSVSISGDYAIGGAVTDDDPSGAGSAYVFHRSGTTWFQQAKLMPSDPASNDQFGNSVSISGNYAIVGADFDDSQTGAAYAFLRSDTSWTQTAKVTASDAALTDYYGESVSISGDYAIVGSWGDDDDGALSGSAYIYHCIDDLDLVVTGVDEETVPEAVRLYAAYPNPFNPQTIIRFDLSIRAMAQLSVYSVSGSRVRTLVDEEKPAGTHSVVWDGRDDSGSPVASGVYFYRLRAGSVTEARKMVLIK